MRSITDLFIFVLVLDLSVFGLELLDMEDDETQGRASLLESSTSSTSATKKYFLKLICLEDKLIQQLPPVFGYDYLGDESKIKRRRTSRIRTKRRMRPKREIKRRSLVGITWPGYKQFEQSISEICRCFPQIELTKSEDNVAINKFYTLKVTLKSEPILSVWENLFGVKRFYYTSARVRVDIVLSDRNGKILHEWSLSSKATWVLTEVQKNINYMDEHYSLPIQAPIAQAIPLRKIYVNVLLSLYKLTSYENFSKVLKSKRAREKVSAAILGYKKWRREIKEKEICYRSFGSSPRKSRLVDCSITIITDCSYLPLFFCSIVDQADSQKVHISNETNNKVKDSEEPSKEQTNENTEAKKTGKQNLLP